jgi:CHASE3 domain sensor protein
MNAGAIVTIIISVLTLIGGMVGIYVAVMLKIKELEVRLQATEKTNERLINKLDDIFTDIKEIAVELRGKADIKTT